MKLRLLFILSVLCAIAFTSCDKLTKEDKIIEVYDCEFQQVDENMDGYIDDQEQEMIQLCDENAFDSKEEIKDNLVGHWILVGHGEGARPNLSQPCAYIIVKTDELTFKFESGTIDVMITTSWDVNEIETSSATFFRLNTGDEYIEGLNISQFCEEYIYAGGIIFDANMYLYKKIK